MTSVENFPEPDEKAQLDGGPTSEEDMTADDPQGKAEPLSTEPLDLDNDEDEDPDDTEDDVDLADEGDK